MNKRTGGPGRWLASPRSGLTVSLALDVSASGLNHRVALRYGVSSLLFGRCTRVMPAQTDKAVCSDLTNVSTVSWCYTEDQKRHWGAGTFFPEILYHS